ALAKYGDKAVPQLVQGLTSKNALLLTEVLHALAAIGPDAKEAIPAPRDLMLGNDPKMSAVAAQALSKIGKEAIGALSAGLNHDDVTVRRAAVGGLSTIGPEAVPALIEVTGHKDVEVRRLAVQRLGQMRVNDKSVAIALGYALKDSDDAVRSNALTGLQLLGTGALPALPQLIEGLKDKV